MNPPKQANVWGVLPLLNGRRFVGYVGVCVLHGLVCTS